MNPFLCPPLQVCGITLPLPPKKLIGNMDREFIAERQRGLQTYLDTITQHPLLCSSLPVKKFLDPNNYSANYTGLLALRLLDFTRVSKLGDSVDVWDTFLNDPVSPLLSNKTWNRFSWFDARRWFMFSCRQKTARKSFLATNNKHATQPLSHLFDGV